ncbi:MAG: TMEM175 family protein [Chitinophagales bacterium]
MNKNRLEAFSDGVLAIIITIMVLEIKPPHTADWNGFLDLLPSLFGYLLSFLMVGIYWNNHHHLLHTAKKVSAGIMWSNLNLLFWLSLVPFATKWMDETRFAAFTVSLYAVLLLLCGFSYSILNYNIYKCIDEDDQLKQVIKLDWKQAFSIVAYSSAIPVAYWNASVSLALFAVVAAIWLIPSKKIEHGVKQH